MARLPQKISPLEGTQHKKFPPEIIVPTKHFVNLNLK